MKTHIVEIQIKKDNEIRSIEGEMSFSNGVAQSFAHSILPPDSSVDSMDELAHLLKRVNEFNRRVDGDIVKIEIVPNPNL